MLDDDVKNVEKLVKTLPKELDGGKRKPKHSEAEKQLCQGQQYLINKHLESCQVCQASHKSYQENMNIPMTPPCQAFLEKLKEHISNCDICNQANQKWNDDAIPVTDEMRKQVHSLMKLRKMLKL